MCYGYSFEFTDSATNQITTKIYSSRYLPLSVVTPNLIAGHVYFVRVKARSYQVWGNYSNICKIALAAPGSRLAYTGDELVSKETDNVDENQTDNVDENQIENIYSESLDFNAYPNPTSDILHISSNYINNEQVTLMINDIAGRIVYQVSMTSKSNETVDLRPFDNGIYCVTIVQENGSKKIIRIVKK